MTLFGYRIPMMASLLIWAVLWEILGHSGLVMLFPPLSEVLVAMAEVVTTGSFLGAAWLTLWTFGAGIALAILVGVPVGILMGRSAVADRLLAMWVNLFVSAPLTALVPIIMILFGLGATTIIITVFLFAVWIIVLDSRAGARGVPPSLLDMARSFGGSRRQTLLLIVVWAALPEILAGIRIGLIRGVKGVVIGQMLVAIIGFGQLFELYSRNFLMAHFWALTLIIFAFALGIASAIETVERRVEYYAGERQT